MAHVALYWPNIIGYVRIVFCLLAVGTFNKSAWTAAAFYAVSEILDALDGHVARWLKQASLMGAVLDQVTDRMSTLAVYMLLCARYPDWAVSVFYLAVCDLAGHWAFTHAQVVRGAESHKAVPAGVFSFLRVYYERKVLMFCCHLAYEVALCGLLVMSHYESDTLAYKAALSLVLPSMPLAVFKMVTNAAQMLMGMKMLIELDSSTRHRE